VVLNRVIDSVVIKLVEQILEQYVSHVRMDKPSFLPTPKFSSNQTVNFDEGAAKT